MSKLNVLPDHTDTEKRGRFPKWLHRPLPKQGALFSTEKILEKYRLNTVCEEAKCPNRWECYGKKTATFLVLGKACTRACGFCDIDFAKNPKEPETDEPMRVALSVKDLGLKHVVITMVARDDLSDGGALHLAKIMQKTRQINPEVTVEVLTSDFTNNSDALDIVLEQNPTVFNHNIETVRRLTSRIRHKATYDRTLKVLSYAKKSKKATWIKSGLMVGLGESISEVKETIQDLKEAGVDIVTIGQYLQASAKKLRVQSFIPPETFSVYEEYGKSLNIRVYAGPFVRSSYNAELFI